MRQILPYSRTGNRQGNPTPAEIRSKTPLESLGAVEGIICRPNGRNAAEGRKSADFGGCRGLQGL